MQPPLILLMRRSLWIACVTCGCGLLSTRPLGAQPGNPATTSPSVATAASVPPGLTAAAPASPARDVRPAPPASDVRPASPASDGPPAVTFQRVFVPEERLWELARELRLRPWEMREFEATVQAIQATSQGPGRVRLADALYRGRWQGGQLVDGRASWTIEYQTPSPSPVESQLAGLNVDPLSLAMHSSWWNSDREVQMVATDKYAALLLVEQSGTFQFTWSLAPIAGSDGLKFSLQVPPSTRTRMELELPRLLTPEVPGAVVRPLAPSPSSRAEENSPSDTTVWEILIASGNSAELTLRRAKSPQPERPRTWLSETRYALTASGMEMQGTLRLSGSETNPDELMLRLDRNISLDALQVQGNAVDWSALTKESDGQYLRLAIPVTTQPWIDITWHGLAHLPTGKFRLPRVSLPGAWWLASKSYLDVAEELFLVDLDLDGAHISQETPHAPRSLLIQHAREDAGLDVVCEQPIVRHRSRLAHHVTLDETNISCLTQIAVEVQGAVPLQSLQLELGADWQIDKVSSQGQNLEWDTEAGQRRLTVLLPTPVKPGSQYQFEVIASRRSEPDLGSAVLVDTLQPLSDLTCSDAEVLMSLGAPSEYTLRVEQANYLEWILDPKGEWNDFRLPPAANRNFRMLARTTTAQVFLDREVPRYRAELEIDVVVGPQQTHHTIRIRCLPEGTVVSKLSLQWLQEADRLPWEWSIQAMPSPTEPAPVASPTQPSLANDSVRFDATENVIYLSQALNREFVLVGHCAVDHDATCRIPLLSLPQATEQRGIVRLAADTSWQWQGAEDLLSLPFDAMENRTSVDQPMVRARFRYDPVKFSSQVPFQLVRAPDHATQLPSAWIWQQQRLARVSLSGHVEHWVTYCLENVGLSTWEIDLPPSAECTALYVQGALQTDRPAGGGGSRLLIPLPTDERYLVITLGYHTLRSPLRTWDRVAVAWPSSALPTQQVQEYLVVPPSYGGRQVGHATGWSQVSWLERLSGPFLPSRNPIGPLWAMWHHVPTQKDEPFVDDAPAWRFVDALGVDLRAGESELTWRELLLQGQSRVPGLQVEPAALRRCGIQPHLLVPKFPSLSSDRKAGLALLKEHGLVVVLQEGGLYLTDHARIHRLSPGRPSWPDGSVYAFGRATPSSPTYGLAAACRPVQVWGMLGWPFVAQEIDSIDLRLAEGVQHGWHVVENQLGPSTPLVVDVEQQQAWGAMGWTAILLSLGLFLRLSQGGHSVSLGAGCACVALAMMAPPPWHVLCTGIWLGWCGALVMSWARPVHPPRPWPTLTVWKWAPWLLVAALSQSGLSQELPRVASESSPLTPSLDTPAVDTPSVDPATTTTDIERVLIPFAESGGESSPVPAGEYVYLREQLFSRLWSLSRDLRALPGAWAIHSADYDMTLEWQRGRWVPVRVTALFAISTTSPTAQIQLPLHRKECTVREARSEPERVPWSTAWDEAGENLLLQAPSMGKSTLRLELQLVPPTNPTQTMLWHVPRIARSQARIRCLGDDTLNSCPVQVPSAAGATRWDASERTLTVPLGSTTEFIVAPIATPAAAAVVAGPAGTVDQKVEALLAPGGLRLTVTANWNLTTPGLTAIRWEIDPAWQLMDVTSDDGLVWSGRRSSARELVCEANQTLPVSGSLRMGFLVPVNRSSTAVTLTTLESETLPTRHRNLVWRSEGVRALPQPLSSGVTIESNSPGVVISPGIISSPGDLAGRATADGSASTRRDDRDGPPPASASYRLPVRESRWLVWDAAESLPPGEREITYELSQGRLTMRLDAELDARGRRFHRIDIPSGWTVRRVEIQALNHKVPIQWAQSSSGSYASVWTDEPLRSHYRLTCLAEQRVSDEGRMTLPSIGLQDVEWSQSVWKLTRPAPEVQWALETEQTEVGLELPQDNDPLSETWYDETPRVLRWQRNIAEAEASSAVYLEHRGTTWQATTLCEVRVVQGRYDEFRLDIPAEWRDRLVLEEFDYDFESAANSNRVTLVVRPTQPIVDRLAFQVDCVLPTSDGPEIVAPVVRWLNVRQQSRYLIVPREVHGQAWAWQATGLAKIDQLPTHLQLEPLPPDRDKYQVMDDRMRLAGQVQDRPQLAPEIPLCDAVLTLWPDGTYSGTVDFDLASPAADDCWVTSPTGMEIQQILVDHQRPMGARLTPSSCRVSLGYAELPQRMTIFFRGTIQPQLVAPTEAMTLALPSLSDPQGEPWRPRNTLWTVHVVPPSGYALPESLVGSDELAQRLVRLQHAQQLMGDVQDRFGNSAEAGRWLALWHARWDQLIAAPLASATPEQRDAFQSFQQWTESGLVEAKGGAKPAVGAIPDLRAALSERPWGESESLRVIATTWQPELTLQRPAPQQPWALPLQGGMAGLAAWGVVWRLSTHTTWRWWYRRHMPLWVMLAGVGWCLALAPAVVGYLLALAAVWSAFVRLRPYWGS